jgi:hypothetical protein
LKSILIGILAAVLGVVLSVALSVIVPVMVNSWQIGSSGSGGLGLVVGVTDISFFAPAVVGFLVGFVWTFRRTSRLARTSR